MDLSNLSDTLSTVSTIITIVMLGGCLAGLKTFLEMRNTFHDIMKRPMIIGVVGGRVPKALTPKKDFSSYKLAVRSHDEVVILHCRTISYALRKCDFVCADVKSDPKIHTPGEATFWASLVEKEA